MDSLKKHPETGFASGGNSATPSNCGKTLRASATKRGPKGLRGQGNDLGYGKNAEDWAIRSQALNPSGTRAVQRLDGGG